MIYNLPTYHAHPSPPGTPENLPMSLYKEPKPERAAGDYHVYLDELTTWELTSHHAYLKETEWKVGDMVKRNYPDAAGYMVGELIEIKSNLLVCKNGSSKEGILKENATHYHENQQIPSSEVSYGREVEKKPGDMMPCGNCETPRFIQEDFMIPKCTNCGDEEWNLIDNEIDLENMGYNTVEWQPAPEPEPTKTRFLYNSDNFYRDIESYKKAHAQWLSDKDKGIIQAEINFKLNN